MGTRKQIELLKEFLGGPPAVGFGRAMGRLADVKASKELLKPAVSLYTALLGVDQTAYEVPEGGFSTFNEFFGRRLAPGTRPVCTDPGAIVSPCDGRLSSFGRMDETGTEFSIKQSRYSLSSLLGSQTDAEVFRGGTFAVIYLHPRDYHRVHAPAPARLTAARHIPGTRYPVTSWCERMVDNIYDKNERMVFFFDFENGGRAALVMVAALGVGNIESPFHPDIQAAPSALSEKEFAPPREVLSGEEIGGFLLGSTVVLIGSREAFALDEGLETGPIKLGIRIGGSLPGDEKP